MSKMTKNPLQTIMINFSHFSSKKKFYRLLLVDALYQKILKSLKNNRYFFQFIRLKLLKKRLNNDHKNDNKTLRNQNNRNETRPFRLFFIKKFQKIYKITEINQFYIGTMVELVLLLVVYLFMLLFIPGVF